MERRYNSLTFTGAFLRMGSIGCTIDDHSFPDDPLYDKDRLLESKL